MKFIYVLRNLQNSKCYVGQTKNPLQRKANHFHAARKGLDRPLYRSIRKWGEENFSFEIIEECEDSFADDREKYWIRELDTRNLSKGYNLTEGGEGIPNPSEEIRQKIRQKLLGRKPSPESIEKTRAKTTGQKRSLEVRKKMSESALARGPHSPLSDDHKRKISELHKGKKRSAETRAKMSQNRKGKRSNFTPEQEAHRKARFLEATLGKKRPESVGHKISDTKAKKFSLELRTRIVTYREQGLSFDKIAELTGIAKTTVFRLYQKSKL